MTTPMNAIRTVEIKPISIGQRVVHTMFLSLDINESSRQQLFMKQVLGRVKVELMATNAAVTALVIAINGVVSAKRFCTLWYKSLDQYQDIGEFVLQLDRADVVHLSLLTQELQIASLLNDPKTGVKFVNASVGELKTNNPQRVNSLSVPLELEQAMARCPESRKQFETLEISQQRVYIEWITAGKKVETRERRALQTVERLTGAHKLKMK